MTVPRPDLRRLAACLDEPLARACGEADTATLRRALIEAVVTEGPDPLLVVHGDRPLGRVLPFGSVALYAPPDPWPLRHRLLDVDRGGHVTLALARGAGGELRGAWVRNADGATLALRPGGASHPLWGTSDRIVRQIDARRQDLLTVCQGLDWTRVSMIPPLADPTRLPPGGGTAILNLLASLAHDQGAGPLRYRGPYPTEQLFWALVESFHFDPAVTDPLSVFVGAAEATFAAGELREAPLDWTPAPHERLFLEDGIYVQLRDGVEKVYWEGRAYYRPAWQGLRRREHRVIRTVAAPDGGRRFVASLEALGRPLEDHLVLDAAGALVDRPLARGAGGPERDAPLGPPWREALEHLLPLESTPLLSSAIQAVWPLLTVVWGAIPGDLVEAHETTVRLSPRLAHAFQRERAALSGAERRRLAHRFVRDVLGLVGPPVRRAAAAWLEVEPPARQESLLEAAARTDRAAAALVAAEPLGRLLTALEAGEALPPVPAR